MAKLGTSRDEAFPKLSGSFKNPYFDCKDNANAPMSKNGFTLIELLVVIAIVALLAALLMPAAKMVRDSAVKARCAANERQVAVTFLSRATDRNGDISLLEVTAGKTPWDVDGAEIRGLMDEFGFSKNIFYCYSLSPKFIEAAWGGNAYVITHIRYLALIQRVQATGGYSTAYVSSFTPGYDCIPEWVNSTAQSNQSQRIIAADPLASYSGNTLWENSSHMGQNGIPTGSNAVYMDGHVQWHPFSQTLIRTVKSFSFWW